MKYLLISTIATIMSIGCSRISNEKLPAEDNDYPKGLPCELVIGSGEKYSPNYFIKMDEAKSKSLDEMVDNQLHFSLLPLEVPEKANIIGGITRYWNPKKDLMIVADLEISKKIYGFNAEGDVLFVIANYGSGPGQFTSLWDVQYNPHKPSIDIWDLPQHKLISYNLNGEYLKETLIKKDIINFYPVTDKWYIYHLDARVHMGKKAPLLLYSDILGEKIINMGAPEYGIVDAMPNKLEFSEYKGSVYYHRPMSDTIYWIGPVNGQICADYVIDFGTKRLPEEAKKQSDLMQASKIIMDAGSSFTLGDLVVGSTYLHFKWTSEVDQSIYHQLVDRHNYLSYTIQDHKLEIYGIRVKGILNANGSVFSGYSYPHQVNFEALSNALKRDDLPDETKMQLRKIQNMKDEENPFIINFTLQHPYAKKYEKG